MVLSILQFQKQTKYIFLWSKEKLHFSYNRPQKWKLIDFNEKRNALNMEALGAGGKSLAVIETPNIVNRLDIYGKRIPGFSDFPQCVSCDFS